VHIHRDSYTAGPAPMSAQFAALGAKAVVAGCLQDDEAGRKLAEILRKRGIKSINLPVKGRPSSSRVIVQHQQLCRLDRESPPASYAVDAKRPSRCCAPRCRRSMR